MRARVRRPDTPRRSRVARPRYRNIPRRVQIRLNAPFGKKCTYRRRETGIRRFSCNRATCRDRILAVECLQNLIPAGESDTEVFREPETDDGLTSGPVFRLS